MLGMVYMVFWMSHMEHFVFWISASQVLRLDGLSGIVDSEFDILEDISLLGLCIW